MSFSANLSHCTLCPRACGVDRHSGRLGFCGAGDQLRIYRYGPHFGEEPPITGSKGSGAVFFSHCTLRCLYCQNYPWSQFNQGEDYPVEKLTAIFNELRDQGCHNWNLVTATPWLPLIRQAVEPIASDKRLPFVYNTSGFESLETLAEYDDLTDIALTDLRYSTPALAQAASGSAEYVERARESLLWFCAKLGPLQTDDDGVAEKGVICRLLVLPGHPEEAIGNLRWIAEHIGPELSVSIMSQYTPVHKAVGNGDWGRKLTKSEYELVTDEADRLGFENGWIQPYETVDDNGLLGCEMSAGEGAVGRK